MSDLSDAICRRVYIDRALSSLRPREELVLRMRANGYTLKEVGWAIGVSPPRVRQIEAKAIRKLQHPRVAGRLAGLPCDGTVHSWYHRALEGEGPCQLYVDHPTAPR